MANFKNRLCRLGLIAESFLILTGTVSASTSARTLDFRPEILEINHVSKIDEVDCDEDVCDVLCCFYEDFQRKRANTAKPQLFFVFTDIDDTLFEECADQDDLIDSYNAYDDLGFGWEWDGSFPKLSKKILLKETIHQMNEYRQKDPSFKVVALTHQRFWNPIALGASNNLVLKNIETCEDGPTYNEVRTKALNHIGIDLSKDFLNGNQCALKPVLDDIQLLQDDLNALVQRNLTMDQLGGSADVSHFRHLQLFEIPSKYRSINMWETPFLVAKDPASQTYKEVIAFPVCEQGMIVCNFAERGTENPQHTERKGDIMWAYLETYLEQNFGTDQTNWPEITIVGIDDQRSMLENMRAICARKGIDFSGIYFHRKKPKLRRW